MNETIEFAILNDGYKPTLEEIKDMAKELWDLKHDALKQKNDVSQEQGE